jgi:hypothetical protein
MVLEGKGEAMQRALQVASVAGLLMVMSALLPAAASATPPTTGTQVSVFAGVDVEIPAGEPFFVRHGWAEEYRPMSTLHSFGFDLYVDGMQRHGPREIVVEDGVWVDQRWIFNFRQGLPAGTYTFYGEWTDLDGIALQREITVTALD